MGKPKHDLEELRGKVKTGEYIGVRQLAFVLSTWTRLLPGLKKAKPNVVF